MAKSLLHKIGIVDIYSNSWAFETLFARMTGLLRSALKKCAKEVIQNLDIIRKNKHGYF
jgi:hypothetical protein